jgi:hypothetical protein
MAGPVHWLATITITIKLPFWWRAYVGVLKFFHDLGILRVDTAATAAFIVRHVSFQSGKWRGKLSK